MKQKQVIPAGSEWRDLSIKDFRGSPSERVGREWMLITAGDTSTDKSNWNTMTAAWGGLGVLWSRDVAFMVIRPSRCTFEFANAHSLFTLSFFPASYRNALNICGSESGRDIDKAAKAGITPIVFDNGAVGFSEASEIIICEKLYTHDLDPSRFLNPSIEDSYHGADYHRLFIGGILTLKAS
ncbi:MAG: flavin reductase family protein [Treponema sp.]|jgi:flavin reductase (DIM6/NTAB) family NADH-FMN oxidoreductase RutF|nr:flavin reductase family protein [Treponema sp.]